MNEPKIVSGSVDDIVDTELLARAMRSLTRFAPRSSGQTANQVVMDIFALGSTYAAQLCRRFGVDPDKRVRRLR
jgi:hypothetical protein